MEILIDGNRIDFNLIQMQIFDKNISNLFAHKNNKTLKETCDSSKYLRLKDWVNQNYQNKLNLPLGDFLNELKKEGDKNYLKFLNKYGDNSYCKFNIADRLLSKGLYCFTERNEIKYLGSCTISFGKRINNGYGNISPKNTYLDGQATNCHINSKINASKFNISLNIYEMNDKTNQDIIRLEKQILANHNFDWNIQKK